MGRVENTGEVHTHVHTHTQLRHYHIQTHTHTTKTLSHSNTHTHTSRCIMALGWLCNTQMGRKIERGGSKIKSFSPLLSLSVSLFCLLFFYSCSCPSSSVATVFMTGLWKVWFWPKIVSTLSTLFRPSKNGMRSRSSVSFGSSNHDVTGT